MSQRATAEERLRRILAVVPWVAERDGPTVEEVCRRFDCTERQLIADMDLLFLCGAYPYTPDSLIEAVIEDGRVWIRYADWFRRPLRLTSAEALALVAAAQALLALPGTDAGGPLARGLAKVASVLGVAPGEGGGANPIEVELGDAHPTVLATVQAGLAAGRRLSLDYYSYGRDGWSSRTVDPWSVGSTAGAWYLQGYCHEAQGQRTFRVDRIRSAALLDEPAAPAPAGVDPARVFSPRPDDPLVVLDLPASARWVASHHPNEGVEERPGGGLRVRLRVSEPAWLERLLLRIGPGTVVVEPEHLRPLGPPAAARLLERYR